MEVSTLEESLASDSSPDHAPDTMDTDMIASLTSRDDLSSKSRSSSSEPLNEMSSYPPNKGPSELINAAQSGRPQRSGTIQGPPGIAWRYEETTSSPQAQTYRTQPYDPNTPMMAGQYSSARPRGNSYMTVENSVPLSTVCPGPVWPTDDQLNTAYGYGIRREDGSITRLLVADEVTNPNVPMRQGPEGLIILPAPRQPSPNRRMGGDAMVPGEVVAGLPPMNRHPRHGLPLRPVLDATQSRIDSIVAQSSSVSPPARRREKIYCDKWIHEGVCAFTQMGCKYKHEMPQDKATQVSLGLTHGIPNWYRRAYAVNLHPESPLALASPPSNGYRTEGPWRRIESVQQSEEIGMQSHARAGSRSSYGPIGPPAFANNPYSTPKVEEMVNEDDQAGDGEAITWKGRRN